MCTNAQQRVPPHCRPLFFICILLEVKTCFVGQLLCMILSADTAGWALIAQMVVAGVYLIIITQSSNISLHVEALLGIFKKLTRAFRVQMSNQCTLLLRRQHVFSK
jgi:hypothetical protein